MMNNYENLMDTELENISGGAANDIQVHHIKSGETLFIIANKYGTTVKELLALNPRIKDASLIYAGDTIRVR